MEASQAVQDYLKALYLLSSEEGGEAGAPVATTALARRLGVAAPSVTNMLKRLDAAGLVTYSRYRGVELTARGRDVGLEVLRHHRLLETYLAEALGVPWDEVHAEAEVLEHVLSERLEDRIADLLGDPTADPHGHPIPGKDGSVPSSGGTRLWDVPVGETVAIERVPDADAEVLRYLAAADITPGAVVEVVGRGPLDGPLLVRAHSAGEPCALSERLARSIGVKEKVVQG